MSSQSLQGLELLELSITKSLVNLHKEKIDIASSVNEERAVTLHYRTSPIKLLIHIRTQYTSQQHQMRSIGANTELASTNEIYIIRRLSASCRDGPGYALLLRG